MCWAALLGAVGVEAATAATIGTVASVAIPVATTMIKMDSDVKAGQEKKRQAEQTAIEVEADNRMAEVQAKQQSRDMLNQYNLDANANNAFFSYMGIDTSESIKAFERKQKSIIFETELRAKNQSALRDARAASESSNLRTAGKNALSASYISALGTGLGAISDYSNIGSSKVKDNKNG